MDQHPVPGNRRREHAAGTGDLDSIAFDLIARYDARTFEADRRGFLRQWIAQPDAVRLGVVTDGVLNGWGLLRPCAEGFKIGPLFADDQRTGELLLDGLLAAAPGERVSLDVPEPNLIASRTTQARGMEPVFETARMYAGQRPDMAVDRIWGVTSFQLG